MPSTPASAPGALPNLKLERDAIVLYDRLAGIEKDPRRAAAFRAIAGNERRHAEIWAARLREAGVDVPDADEPRPRVRVIIGLARVFGTRAVSDLVKSLEGDEQELYEAQSDPSVASIMADEREHAEIWQRLDAGLPGLAEADGDVATAPTSAMGIRPRGEESWHRAGRAGTLRAAIFGVSDGLVSNLSLVMGVAGAAADNKIIVLAGIAGLLAGAFSMAAGEYISMQSQRELFERQIDLEREEMKIMPEAEERELAAIYPREGTLGQRGGHGRAPADAGPESGARHQGARGARPRPGGARVTVGRGAVLVPRVRWRARSCRCCRSCSATGRRRSSTLRRRSRSSPCSWWAPGSAC